MNYSQDIMRPIVHVVFGDIVTRLSILREELRCDKVSGMVEDAVGRRLYWAVREQVGMQRMMASFKRDFDIWDLQ